MFARITKFKMKSDHVAQARALINDLKQDILALPGLVRFINVMNEDGSGYIVSLVQSREISDGNADKVKAIWMKFADHLEAMPVPEGFDVESDWST